MHRMHPAHLLEGFQATWRRTGRNERDEFKNPVPFILWKKPPDSSRVRIAVKRVPRMNEKGGFLWGLVVRGICLGSCV